jgi:hypothetical protein
VILAFNILHLLEDTAKIMQRINDLLQPGGYFISDTPCLGEKRSPLGIVTALISKLPLLPYVKNFRVADLKCAITNGNLTVVETQNLSTFPPTLLVIAQKI